MNPLDLLLPILGCYAILRLRGRVGEDVFAGAGSHGQGGLLQSKKDA